MKTRILRQITLYRYRYVIGYIVFGILLFALLLLAIDQVPRGLSTNEMGSAVTSVNIDVLHPTAVNVIDAPYHVIQKASIQYFGLTPLAIKLPSIIIGAITGVSIILMLQRWFRKNVAILTALIIVTSVGFLGLARTGTPLIMTAFWAVMLLWGATHVLYADRYRFFWKLFCLIATALLAYSPFGIYPLLALVLAGIFHPHVRYRLAQGRWWQHVISAIAVIVTLLPLTIATVHTPQVILQLIGADSLQGLTWTAALTNAFISIKRLFDFTDNTAGQFVTPMFGLATMVLLLLGLLKLITARYSARSYMIFIWLILLIPVLIVRPDMLTLVIVPATLILAIGVETLIRQWYDLFPRNPYARIAALIPLSVLLISIVSINMERYFYGYHYSAVTTQYHQALPATRHELVRLGSRNGRSIELTVRPEQVQFYDLLRREYPKLQVTSTRSGTTPAVVLADTGLKSDDTLPSRIVTSDLSTTNNAVILRVYGD